MSVFSDAVAEGHPDSSPILRRCLRERLPTLEREITDIRIADTQAGYRRALVDRTALGVGECMRVIWQGC